MLCSISVQPRPFFLKTLINILKDSFVFPKKREKTPPKDAMKPQISGISFALRLGNTKM